MQLLCPQVFGCEWHAAMKAADATNASIGCFFYAAEAPPPLLYYFLCILSTFKP